MKFFILKVFLFLFILNPVFSTFGLTSSFVSSLAFAQDDDFEIKADDDEDDFDIDTLIDEAQNEDPDLEEDEDQEDVAGFNEDDIDEELDTEIGDFNEDEIDEEIDNLQSPKESEPIYRPSSLAKASEKGRGKYIYHPNQKKGLFKIDRDGKYYYKVDSSKRKGSLSFKGGVTSFRNLQDPDTGLSFSDIYGGSTAPSISFEWEWKPFKKFKTLSLKVASGLVYARGNGQRFDTNTGLPVGEAQESYNFIYLPNTVGATYRFRQYYKQLFVPFVTGGIDYHLATEIRDDFNRTRFLGIPATHFGGGVDINLGWLERLADIELDREFGINNTFFTLEVRQIIAINTDRDIANTMFVAGFHFEY